LSVLRIPWTQGWLHPACLADPFGVGVKYPHFKRSLDHTVPWVPSPGYCPRPSFSRLSSCQQFQEKRSGCVVQTNANTGHSADLKTPGAPYHMAFALRKVPFPTVSHPEILGVPPNAKDTYLSPEQQTTSLLMPPGHMVSLFC
jgi:hypothetical protein